MRELSPAVLATHAERGDGNYHWCTQCTRQRDGEVKAVSVREAKEDARLGVGDERAGR
jgi:hypothetical protein